MMRHFAWTVVLLVLTACGGSSRLPSDRPVPAASRPDSFEVTFRTSRGTVVAMIHRAWSPLAADRVFDLVERKVWDDLRIYRVVPNFVVQFGLTGDSAVNAAWRTRGLEDEPVRELNRRGRIAFARAGPETRSVQVFINLRDNPRLDTLEARGVVGYPPFGEVTRGMEVVDSLHGGYGNAPAQRQDSIGAQGNRYLDREFPLLDRILEARVTRVWRRERRGRRTGGKKGRRT